MDIIKLLRVHQWVKNALLFVPAFFAAEMLEEKSLMLIPAFFAFSLISSAVYVINDYRDIEADKVHPTKRNRPLASGVVSKSTGLIVFFVLLLAGGSASYLISIEFFGIIALYFTINLGYSFGLKNTPILEMFLVSIGFLLRVVAGATVSATFVSHWLVIMVFLLALFLILAKRRDDLVMYLNTGKANRESITHYSLDFINASLTMMGAVIIVTYIAYCVSEEVISRFGNPYVYATTIFVIAGLMRYLKIALTDQKSGSPVKTLYTDKFIIITLLGWVLSFVVIIYSGKLF